MAQMTSHPLVICKNQKTGSDTRYTRASGPVFSQQKSQSYVILVRGTEGIAAEIGPPSSLRIHLSESRSKNI